MNLLSPEDQQQLARFALDRADESAFWTDPDGKIVYANSAACQALGYSGAEILAMTIFQWSPEMTPALWAQLWKEAKERGSFAFEFTQRSKEGRVFPVEMTVHYCALPGKELLCGFFRDVNEKKHLQQLKDEFVSTVSHELRTPMTIIRESVSQVLDGLWGKISPRHREALAIALTGIDRLARIINDLLDASKMDAGKVVLRWESFNLVDVVQEVIETFGSRAKDRGIELRGVFPHRGVEAYADRDRIVQVLTNLIGNSLKFSEKGNVKVRVHEKDSNIECSVADTGMGIAPDDLDRVFHKFVQVGQPAMTGEKGTGLGLSICKGIVELHGGKIWVQSELNHGATFFFTLPKRTVKDLFRQRIQSELRQAVAKDGALTIVHFDIRERRSATSPQGSEFQPWALEELMQIIRTHGARKTDIVMKDSDAVWLGLPHMVKKESARLVERVLNLFDTALSRKSLTQQIHVTTTLCNFPEDAKTEPDLMKLSLLDGEHRAA